MQRSPDDLDLIIGYLNKHQQSGQQDPRPGRLRTGEPGPPRKTEDSYSETY